MRDWLKDFEWDDCVGWKLKHPLQYHLERRCQKCGVPTKGEEAYINGEFWCHPCADALDADQQLTPEGK